MFCIYNKWATYQNLGGFCFVDLEKHDENLTVQLDPNLSCLKKTPDFSCKRMRMLKNVNTKNHQWTFVDGWVALPLSSSWYGVIKCVVTTYTGFFCFYVPGS